MKSSQWMYVALFAALAISVQLAAQDNPNHQSTFTTFDAPGAGTGSYQGTYPFAINPEGAITGLYVDASNMYHGFLRDRDGTFTTFDFWFAGQDDNQFRGSWWELKPRRKV